MDRGEIREMFSKWMATRGVVKNIAPIVAQTVEITKLTSALTGFFSFFRIRRERSIRRRCMGSASRRMPATAPKDSCSPM